MKHPILKGNYEQSEKENLEKRIYPVAVLVWM